MDADKIMSRINEGTTAAVCLNWMEPFFKEIETSIISDLKNSYRMGKYTEASLASCAASLLVIEELKNKLSSKARAAESARKELGEDE